MVEITRIGGVPGAVTGPSGVGATGQSTPKASRADVLEIRRLRMPRLYDLPWEKPPPLVERALRQEVTERIDYTLLVTDAPLDEAIRSFLLRRRGMVG